MIHTRFVCVFLFLAITLSSRLALAGWSAEPDRKGGMVIGFNSSTVVSSYFAGWEKDWKWAGTQFSYTEETPQGSSFHGVVGTLGIDFDGNVHAVGDSRQEWNYQWTRNEPHLAAIGYGLEFKLDLSSLSQAGHSPEVVLLPNRKGWMLKTDGQPAVTVTFDPPAAEIGTLKGRVRAMLFKRITTGSSATRVTVSLPGGSSVYSMVDQMWGDRPDASWSSLSLDQTTTPIDLSFLNADDLPAGRHGVVHRQGDRLVFADGTEARFWGTNLQAYALFRTDDAKIEAQARRIAQLGFNLVRIHHIDSYWVRSNIFGYNAPDTLYLDDAALDKLDRWIHHLEQNGVYVWLDLHIQRKLTRGDGIDFFNDFAKGKDAAELRGFNYFNDSIEAAMKRFNEDYLGHFNPYTGKTYAEDPGIVTALITNENDLTRHYGNALLGNKGVPIHHQLFRDDAEAFSAATGLSLSRVMRTWEPGESKMFLSDVEHGFNQRMIDHLRNTIGFDGLVTTTHLWGGMPLYGLPSLTDGDMVDVHQYLDSGFLWTDPRYQANFASRIAAAQVEGMPLSVSEWNLSEFPATDRFLAPLYFASVAAFQGWDAPILYGYSQYDLNGYIKISNWASYMDPGLMGVMPAAALLYRRQHVRGALTRHRIAPSVNELFHADLGADSSAGIRTLAEQGGLVFRPPNTPALPWLHAKGFDPSAVDIGDLNGDYLGGDATKVVSDTGEMERNWVDRTFFIDTDRSKVAEGFIAGQVVDLGGVRIDLRRPSAALVAVQSLTNDAIVASRRILITLMSRTVPVAGSRSGEFLSEPMRGVIQVSAPDGLAVYALAADGSASPAVFDQVAGGYRIPLAPNAGARWFLIEAGDGGAGSGSSGGSGGGSTAGGTSQPVEVVLQEGLNGYRGSADAWISVFHPDANNGDQVDLKDKDTWFRLLVRFPVFQSEGGPVPDGAIIESASLELYKSSYYDQVYRACGLLGSWNENSVTWRERIPGVSWASAGASAVGSDVAAQCGPEASVGWDPAWLSLDVTASLASMATGQVNHGWLLDARSGSRNIKHFVSSEATSATQRPRLRIVYRTGN